LKLPLAITIKYLGLKNQILNYCGCFANLNKSFSKKLILVKKLGISLGFIEKLDFHVTDLV